MQVPQHLQQQPQPSILQQQPPADANNQPQALPQGNVGRGRGNPVSSYPPVQHNTHATDAHATPSWQISHEDMEAYVTAVNATPFTAQVNAAVKGLNPKPYRQ